MNLIIERKDWEMRIKQAEAMIDNFKKELLMWDIILDVSKKELEKLGIEKQEDHDTVV